MPGSFNVFLNFFLMICLDEGLCSLCMCAYGVWQVGLGWQPEILLPLPDLHPHFPSLQTQGQNRMRNLMGWD